MNTIGNLKMKYLLMCQISGQVILFEYKKKL